MRASQADLGNTTVPTTAGAGPPRSSLGKRKMGKKLSKHGKKPSAATGDVNNFDSAVTDTPTDTEVNIDTEINIDAHSSSSSTPGFLSSSGTSLEPMDDVEEELLEHRFLGKTGTEIRKYRESQYNCVNCQFDIWDLPEEHNLRVRTV